MKKKSDLQRGVVLTMGSHRKVRETPSRMVDIDNSEKRAGVIKSTCCSPTQVMPFNWYETTSVSVLSFCTSVICIQFS